MKHIDRSERGATSPLGVALLVGIVFLSSALIIGGFFTIVGGQSQGAQANSVVSEMVTLQSEIDRVVTTSTSAKTVNMEYGSKNNGQLAVENEGSITVTVGGTTVSNGSVGRVRFSNNQYDVTYQSGAVVQKSTRRGASLVTPPDIELSQTGATRTLRFQIIETVPGDGDASPASIALISQTSISDEYPQLYVPAGDDVVIEVESKYASAWKRLFENRLGGWSAVTVTSTGDEVTVEIDGSQHGGMYLHLTRAVVTIESR